MKMRLIEEDFPDDPHMNMAADEAVFQEIMRGSSPPTFRFYRNNNAVILGCFQLAEQEVDMEYARANNIKIVKRMTGGGAVYHDMGDLNYSVITPDTMGIGMNVEKLFSAMINVVVTSFKSFLPDAANVGLNDVSVNGKKVLGAAASINTETLLFHAAVLVDTNLNTLATVLKVPGVKLKDKGVKTILERVANIKALSGKGIDDVRQALLDGYSRELGFEYEKGEYFRELVRKGAEIIIVPSYWWFARSLGVDGNFMKSLIMSRTFENGVIIAYCNAAGRSKKHELLGRSQIAVPWALRRTRCLDNNKEGLLVSTVDTEYTRKAQEWYGLR